MQVIMLMLLCFCVNAIDLQGQISHKSGLKIDVSPGETFDGVLRIWPYGERDIEKLRKLEGKRITPYFFLHRIDDLLISPNNYDVVEVYGNFIIITDFGITSFLIWKYDNVKIPITIKNITVSPLSKTPKKMYMIDQEYERALYLEKYMLVIGILIICIVVISVFYYQRYIRGNRNYKRFERKARREWIAKFDSASCRTEYEYIYSNKKEWIKYLKIDNSILSEYCSVVEAHQYKKNWNEDMILEVKSVHGLIREGLLAE